MTLTTCVDLAGANGATYQPVATDVGRPIQLAVTAANIAGSVTAVSTPTAPVREAFGLTRTRSSRVTLSRTGTAVVSLGLRTDPLVIVATNDEGDRTQATFRVRVRL